MKDMNAKGMASKSCRSPSSQSRLDVPMPHKILMLMLDLQFPTPPLLPVRRVFRFVHCRLSQRIEALLQ